MRYSSDGKSQAASHPPCGGGLQHPWSCFGCVGPHPYSEFCGNEGHVIICPNKDNPGVRENAARNIEKNAQEPEKTIIRTPRGRILGLQIYPTLMSRARSA